MLAGFVHKLEWAEPQLAVGCAAGRKGIAISFPFKGWNTWTDTDIQQAVQVPSMLFGLHKSVFEGCSFKTFLKEYSGPQQPCMPSHCCRALAIPPIAP